jgi:hypothetical protein
MVPNCDVMLQLSQLLNSIAPVIERIASVVEMDNPTFL